MVGVCKHYKEKGIRVKREPIFKKSFLMEERSIIVQITGRGRRNSMCQGPEATFMPREQHGVSICGATGVRMGAEQ